MTQKNDSLQLYFNIVKQKLSTNREKEAIPYLLYLIQRTSENSNLKYLLGAAYVEANIINSKSIELLKEARKHISMEYNPNSLYEKNTPIYVHYYLSIAFAQNGKCDSAIYEREKFGNKYPFEDQFYIKESKRRIDLCLTGNGDVRKDSIPTFIEFNPRNLENTDWIQMEEVQNKTDSASTNIVIKELKYSTKSPLYGVQLGAFKEAIPVRRFPGIKNVVAFIDNEDMMRYVVGHFSYMSQAESLLEFFQQKGFQEAFVVNVNNEEIFKNVIISVDDQNIQSKSYGKVYFSIQLGAFKGKIPEEIAALYLTIDGIIEDQIDELSIVRVGNYLTYEEATNNLEQMKKAGINDAFIIALEDGEKISLEEAIKIKKVKK